MNKWQNRLATGLLFLAVWFVHGFCMNGGPNTPIGMLIFHGSAACVDLLLLYVAPFMLQGKLCGDTQNLCWISIAVNFAGWIMYMSWIPSIVYNSAQAILCFIQLGRLFLVDGDNANYMGRDLVRSASFSWPKFYFREKDK